MPQVSQQHEWNTQNQGCQRLAAICPLMPLSSLAAIEGVIFYMYIQLLFKLHTVSVCGNLVSASVLPFSALIYFRNWNLTFSSGLLPCALLCTTGLCVWLCWYK